MYEIIFTKPFLKQSARIAKNNKGLQGRITKVLNLLSEDPLYPALKTHKYQDKFSSSVTGDLRIIWKYGNRRLTILALDIGGHSGKHSVYK